MSKTYILFPKVLKLEGQEWIEYLGKKALTPYGESLLVKGDKIDGIIPPKITISNLDEPSS